MSLEVFHDPTDAQLRDLRLTRLLQYWRRLGGVDGVPARAALDPAEIGPALPWVFLVDVGPDSAYRYRLVGTQIVQEMGYDPTGQLVAAAYAGTDWTAVRQDYDWVRANRLPCLTRNTVMLPDRASPYRYNRLLLPLTASDGPVDMLLGASIAERAADAG